MVFEGTTGVHERMYRFNSKCLRKRNMPIENGLKEIFFVTVLI